MRPVFYGLFVDIFAGRGKLPWWKNPVLMELRQFRGVALRESFCSGLGRWGMLIQVGYDDRRYDYVKDFMLDKLIEAGTIAKFRRSSGWVRVGVDPVRQRSSDNYDGLERRRAVNG